MIYLRGEVWGKARVTFLLLSSSQIPLAYDILQVKVPYFGVVCPDPYQWITTNRIACSV